MTIVLIPLPGEDPESYAQRMAELRGISVDNGGAAYEVLRSAAWAMLGRSSEDMRQAHEILGQVLKRAEAIDIDDALALFRREMPEDTTST